MLVLCIEVFMQPFFQISGVLTDVTVWWEVSRCTIFRDNSAAAWVENFTLYGGLRARPTKLRIDQLPFPSRSLRDICIIITYSDSSFSNVGVHLSLWSAVCYACTKKFPTSMLYRSDHDHIIMIKQKGLRTIESWSGPFNQLE